MKRQVLVVVAAVCLGACGGSSTSSGSGGSPTTPTTTLAAGGPADDHDHGVRSRSQAARDPGREPSALRQQRHGAARDVLGPAPDPRDLPADQRGLGAGAGSVASDRRLHHRAQLRLPRPRTVHQHVAPGNDRHSLRWAQAAHPGGENMRRAALMAVLLAATLGGACSSDDDRRSSTPSLSPDNEVPARASGASGRRPPDVRRHDGDLHRPGLEPQQLHHGPHPLRRRGSRTDPCASSCSVQTPALSIAQGTLVEGSFTAANVTGIDFATLIEEMRAGTAYVNFHTTTLPRRRDPRPGPPAELTRATSRPLGVGGSRRGRAGVDSSPSMSRERAR